MSKPEAPTNGVEYNLSDIAETLRKTDPYTREGRTAKTLVHTSDMRVVLVVMKAGERMPEHDANATATVQVLQGELQMELPRGEVRLGDGHLLAMEACLRHDVEALSDSTFLLTLGWTK